jgi:acyl-CoA dehydrogenase
MPSDTVEVEGLGVMPRPWPLGANALGLRGALFRAAQIAGALTGLEEMTRRYVGERAQFGKPIGSFQAVQQHTVLLAQCAELTSVAVWQAAEASRCRPASFEIAAARLIASESARLAVRAAHQAHGAIGMTREYPLHLLTRRLNTWQHEFGTERSARLALGQAAAATSGGLRHILLDHDNALEVPWTTT